MLKIVLTETGVEYCYFDALASDALIMELCETEQVSYCEST